MKMILETTLVLVAIFSVPTEQTPVIASLDNGEKIPLDLTVHHGYALVVSGNPLVPQPFFKPSINLYDMEKNLEARKVMEDGACYVRKFSGPGKPNDVGQKMKAMQMSKETHHVTEYWNIPESEIKEADRQQVLGKRVNDFCSGYQVFWLKEGNHVTKRQEKPKTDVTGNVDWNPDSGITTSVQANHKFDNGMSANGGLSHNKHTGVTSNLGAGYEKDGTSLNGGLSHNKHTGVTSNLEAGYEKDGTSLNGGLSHNKHTGVTSNLEAGYEKDGTSLNGGLSHNKHTGVTSNLGAGYEKDGTSLNGGLSHNKHTGVTSNLGAGYEKDGTSFHGGLSHNKHTGVTSNLGAGYEKDGTSLNGELSHNKHTGLTSEIGASHTFDNGASIRVGLTHNHRFGDTGPSFGFSFPFGKR